MSPLERLIRDSYGRMVSRLTCRGVPLEDAEDAVSRALQAALEHWPVDGVPTHPVAWLATVARNDWIDRRRRSQAAARILEELARMEQHRPPLDSSASESDDRLRMLFGLAHPSLDAALHAPLMLQVVLGLDAAAIGSAFLVPAATMAQRLVRAKTKIRLAGIPFDCEPGDESEARIDAVLEAIYTAFNACFLTDDRADLEDRAVVQDAIQLARIVVRQRPDHAESRGLLALMLFVESRRQARHAAGRFVPLDEQDVSLWDESLIAEADGLLRAAARERRVGGYLLEAAIQSVHADRRRTGITEWGAIHQLYRALLALHPGLGVRVAAAVAAANATSPANGLAELETLSPEQVARYQPYWVARAHLLKRLGRGEEAESAARIAEALTNDPALRDHLRWL